MQGISYTLSSFSIIKILNNLSNTEVKPPIPSTANSQIYFILSNSDDIKVNRFKYVELVVNKIIKNIVLL